MKTVRLLLSTLLCCGLAQAANYALIMGIGHYDDAKISELKGARFDMSHMQEVAQQMGVPSTNIHVLFNQGMELDGMRAAMQAFSAKLGAGDRALLYFSGHGGRVRDPQRGSCAEALVAKDGRWMFDSEFQDYLNGLANKLTQLIVMVDSCHSGGAGSRTRNVVLDENLPEGFTPKSIDLGGNCEKPVNVLTRSVATFDEKGPDNLIYIGAARADEVSFDAERDGGLLTSAWRNCMGHAQDQDASGVLTVAEIARCSQDKINQKMQGVSAFRASTVTVIGEGKTPFALASGSTPATVSTNLGGVFNDLLRGGVKRSALTVQTDTPSLRIGKDPLQFKVQSRQDGYLYVLMLGSSQRAITVLFPNRLDPDNRIKAGELSLPRQRWRVKAAGPVGQTRLLFVLSSVPLALESLQGPQTGVFAELGQEISGAKLQGVLGTLGGQACGKRCGYAAAELSIEERN